MKIFGKIFNRLFNKRTKLSTVAPSQFQPPLTLEECTLINTPKFSLHNNSFQICKVLNVIDGDTVDLAINHDGKFYSFRSRLAGIDTPEMKPPENISNREILLQSAKESKDYLWSLTINKILLVKIIGQEKYGRLLVELYQNEHDISINQMIIQSGHGKPYNGGKKL